jgi:r-opsin
MPPPPPPPTPVDVMNRTARGVAMTDFETRYPVGLWKEHGLYTDDYARLINAHWFKFAPPDPASHYALAFLYTVIMVFGCFGNSLVIFMYIK